MAAVNYEEAKARDLGVIVALLFEDNLGKDRESLSEENIRNYEKAFARIEADRNNLIAVGKVGDEIISCCQLTIIPNLSFGGTTRLLVEGVRVKAKYRGQGLGQDLMKWVMEFGRQNDCGMIELTTNKKRNNAKNFYEKLGFENTHEGMKLFV